MRKKTFVIVLVLSLLLIGDINCLSAGWLTSKSPFHHPTDAPVYTIKAEVTVLEWHDFQEIVKRYVGSYNQQIIGLCIRLRPTNQISIYLSYPNPKGTQIESWKEFEEVLGHEIIHALIYQNSNCILRNPDLNEEERYLK